MTNFAQMTNQEMAQALRGHLSYVRMIEMVAENTGNADKINAARKRYDAALNQLEMFLVANPEVE